MVTENKIFKYTQIYDYLKNIKFDEYISDKRTDIHNQLYEQSLTALIKDVNSEIVPKTKVAQIIKDKLIEYNKYQDTPIKSFDKLNFKFIEIKNKVWYKPSRVNIIYTYSPVKTKIGKYTRLVLGTFELDDYWNNNYIFKRNIENHLSFDKTIYTITYIDYIKGICMLYDKLNFKTLTIDLDYILNINDYEISELYKESFIVKRKNNNN